MTSTDALNLVEELFTQFKFIGIPNIMSIMLIGITLFLISRGTNKWRVYLYPVAMLYTLIGIPPNIPLLIFAVILFVIDIISIVQTGDILRLNTITKTAEILPSIKTLRTERRKERIRAKTREEGILSAIRGAARKKYNRQNER